MTETRDKESPHLITHVETTSAPVSDDARTAVIHEALTPLKHLADAYHVSILAVHHLRKTGSSDVLDEITGSTGKTGAIDGALILKREPHLALSFDATTAHWTLVGDADEVGRSRARQQILALLREQQPDGMKPREIAEALEKNFHTIRSILRKMEEDGEVGRLHGRYATLSTENGHGPMLQSPGINQQEQVEPHQLTCIAPPGGNNPDEIDSAAQSDYVDDSDGKKASRVDRI